MEHYTIKIDIIRYYSLSNMTKVKLVDQKYEYTAV